MRIEVLSLFLISLLCGLSFAQSISSGEAWDSIKYDNGTSNLILYSQPKNYWNGEKYSPISKSVVAVGALDSKYQDGYRISFSGGFSAYFKPDISTDSAVCLVKGTNEFKAKPFGIAYKNGKEYGYLQSTSSSTGISKEGEILYANVFEGVDLRYNFEGGELKERIILNDKFKATISKLKAGSDVYIVFKIDYGTLTPKINGKPVVFGEKTYDEIGFFTADDTKAYSFAEVQIDLSTVPTTAISNGDYALPTELTRTKDGTFYAVLISVDLLNKTTFPLEIDPTVQLGVGYLKEQRYMGSVASLLSIQNKWDISSIDKSANITDVQWCGYLSSTTNSSGLLDTDLNFSRVNNQTWKATDSASAFSNHSLTDENMTQVWSSVVYGQYVCTNITQPFLTEITADNNNFSIRFTDPDATPILPYVATYGGTMYLGNIGPIPRHYMVFTNGFYYLNVTYGASSCKTITSNYNLYSDVSSTSTCFTIGADNITLNCNGYSIIGNLSTNAYGILASGRTNITIKNCMISNYSTSIYLNNTANSIVLNTTIYNTTGINGADGTSGASCTGGGAGQTSIYGIYSKGSTSNQYTNINMTNISAGHGGDGGSITSGSGTACNGGIGGEISGMYLVTSPSNNLTNVSFNSVTAGYGGDGGDSWTGTAGNGGAGGASSAFYISDSSSASNQLLSVTVNGLTGGDGGRGGSCDFGGVGGTGAGGGLSYALYTESTSLSINTSNVFNTLSGQGGFGGSCQGGTAGKGGISGYNIAVFGGASFLSGNNISIAHLTGPFGIGTTIPQVVGVLLLGDSNSLSNVYVFNLTPISGGLTTSCLYISGGSNSNITNSTLSQSYDWDIYIGANSQNTTFLNTSFNKSKFNLAVCKIKPCNATIQWYARLNITSGGSPLTSTIKINDTFNNSIYSGYQTLTPYFIVNDTIYSKIIVYANTYFNNHAIYVNNSGYTSNLTTFNFSYADATVNITMYSTTPASSCTYTSGNWVINLADQCNITSSQYLPSNTLTFSGTSGYVTFGNPTGATLVMTVQKFIWSGTGSVYMWFKNSTWFNGSMGG